VNLPLLKHRYMKHFTYMFIKGGPAHLLIMLSCVGTSDSYSTTGPLGVISLCGSGDK
jgi:hypothetical protein